MLWIFWVLVYACFFFSSRRRHTRCALVTGVQTCALPIYVGVPKIAAVIDGGVAVGIEDDVAALRRQRGDDAQIGLVSGRKDDGVIGAVEVLQRVFHLAVALIGAVQHAAAGGAGSIFVQRFLARRDPIGRTDEQPSE